MRQGNQVAVLGLGVMGANLARNFASRGYKVAVYNRNPEVGRKVVAEHPEADFALAGSLSELVQSLERPRRLVLMVSAGSAVDQLLDQLAPLLEPEDVVVDAGNSLYLDTERRLRGYTAARFVGMGVSGGSEGALKGPAIMPGGSKEAYARLEPLLTAISARSNLGPCVTWCGNGSAGHFVKMVHNGIEYGDMQLISETAVLLRQGLGLEASAVADTFSTWNEGALGSYLIEITADIFRVQDPVSGGLLLDQVLDRAGQKGTGKWTVVAAAELGVPIPVIASAVDARLQSARLEQRVAAEAALKPARGRLTGVSTDDLADALLLAKVASYSQGFDLLAEASRVHGYEVPLSEVARVWTGGCIIRARFLEDVARGLQEPTLLALSSPFLPLMARGLPRLRRTVAAAATAGLAVPALSIALGWLETLTTARGSASLLQAQRDYFGSHTYERVDQPGSFVHSEWASLAAARR